MKCHLMNTKIILGIVIIIILSVPIIAYVHFSSSTKATLYSSLSTATISIDPATLLLQTANIGQTIQVNINVSNVQELWGWDFTDITFNSSVVSLTQVQEGPFLQTKGKTFFIWTKGAPSIQTGDLPEIVEALGENTSASGNGTLATLEFSVVSAGTSQIVLTSAKLYDPIEIQPNPYQETGTHEQINSTATNGKVVIANITS
jgi:hypothetical protein